MAGGGKTQERAKGICACHNDTATASYADKVCEPKKQIELVQGAAAALTAVWLHTCHDG